MDTEALKKEIGRGTRPTAVLPHRLAADPADLVVRNMADHINTRNETLDLLAEHPQPFIGAGKRLTKGPRHARKCPGSSDG